LVAEAMVIGSSLAVSGGAVLSHAKIKMQDITVLKFLKIMPSPHRFLSRSKSMRFSFLTLFGFLFGCTQ
jgi:hypothetical protein